MTPRDHKKMAQVAKIKCQACPSRWNLHRHHIVPRSITQCDDPENLAVLCDDCHRKVHSHELDLGIVLTPSQGAKSVLLLKTVYAAYLHLYPSESPKAVA